MKDDIILRISEIIPNVFIRLEMGGHHILPIRIITYPIATAAS